MDFVQSNLTSIGIITSIYFIFFLFHLKQEKVTLKNLKTKKTKKIPCLFSWTSIMFFFLLPLYRGDFEWFLTYLLVTIFTAGTGVFVLAFLYNRIYIHKLITNGYIANDKKSGELIFSKILT